MIRQMLFSRKLLLAIRALEGSFASVQSDVIRQMFFARKLLLTIGTRVGSLAGV